MLEEMEKLIAKNNSEIIKEKLRLEDIKKNILEKLEEDNTNMTTLAELKNQLEDIDKLLNMLQYNLKN